MTCPAGYEAIDGGVDSEYLVVNTLDSYPMVGGVRPVDGSTGPATGWKTEVENTGNTGHPFQWYAICAQEG